MHFVSWMARTSQSLRWSQASTRSARARSEFTFQVAIFTLLTYRGRAAAGKAARLGAALRCCGSAGGIAG
ncbi:hypothetical protein NtRootA9_06090 [Arthrobacter sp. NtRootA9]|nr:hypothetical protein NtRootA9_06090 [Arthrobacter sp. NtRootA9]